MWFLALFSVVFSGVLLALSAFPGVLEQFPARAALVAAGVVGLLASGAVSWHLFGPARPGRPRQRRSALVVLLTLAATPALLLTDTPRRILFRRHQAEFEALLPQAPPPGDREVVPLNADMEVLWVDQWGTDRRGGTYFRTLAADRGAQSFGFAHRPNDRGSPFGDARYEVRHLSGDWYSFAAAER